MPIILDDIALAVQAIPPISIHFSIAWSVCHLTNLDAIWHVHLWGPVTRVRCVWPPGERET